MRIATLVILFGPWLAAGAAGGEPRAAAGAPPGARSEKVLPGMSVVGNDDAPKSLVIVPWKSSALGDTLDVSRGLDAGRKPVDREVFARELDYYEIRAASGSNRGAVAR